MLSVHHASVVVWSVEVLLLKMPSSPPPTLNTLTVTVFGKVFIVAKTGPPQSGANTRLYVAAAVRVRSRSFFMQWK